MVQAALTKRPAPFTITLIYVLAGGLWVIFFDVLLIVMFNGPAAIAWLSVMKECAFISVTASLLYLLILRRDAVIERSQSALYRVKRTVKTLSECNQALVRITDEQKLMGEICRIIVDTGGYRLAWVGFAEKDAEKSVRPVAQWGFEEGYLESLHLSWADCERGRGPTGKAIRTGLPYVVQNIQSSPDYNIWRDNALKHSFASSLSLPLLEGERSFGILNIYAIEADAFDDDEVNHLQELAADLAYGIVNLRMMSVSRQQEKERIILASVIEQSRQGVILFTANGSIHYVNPTFENICGYARQEMIGKDCSILASSQHNEVFFKALTDTFSQGDDRSAKFTLLAKGGDSFEIDATFSPVRDDAGAIISFAAVLRNMTHEVVMERQLRQAQKMEAIGTLAGGIAHDFNNILGVVITGTEMTLNNIQDDNPSREILDIALKAANRGRSLVKQILAFSRQGEQERQPIWIGLILKECLKLLRSTLPATIEIRQQVPPGLGSVLGDPTQIHQIIINLCTNAAHAMRDRRGVLELSLGNVNIDAKFASTHTDLHPGPYLKMTVSDTGHGMPPEVMERIFDPFFTTKGKSEGTGLGLSVVHGIVKNHGGTISVNSEPGRGTTFQLYFPQIASIAASEEAGAFASLPGGCERILYVDDDEDLAVTEEKMLQSLGYFVFATTSSVDALTRFSADPGQFDLIITDQTMPQMSGKELTMEIRRLRPDIPVILCSGYSYSSGGSVTSEEARSIGIQELLQKPVDSAEMAGTIRRVLDEHQHKQ